MVTVDTVVTSSTSGSRSRMKRIFIGLLILSILLGLSFHFYKRYSLKSTLRPLVLKDNILIEEMLTIAKTSPNITYAEYFEKAKKNLDSREDIIYGVKVLSPYLYKKELDLYLELLNVENEYIRSEVALSRALLEASSKFDWSQRERSEYISSSYYSSDIYRRSYLRSLDEAKKAYEDYGKKRADYTENVKKLLSKEKLAWKELSSLMPNRNIISILEEKLKEQTKKEEALKK